MHGNGRRYRGDGGGGDGCTWWWVAANACLRGGNIGKLGAGQLDVVLSIVDMDMTEGAM